MDSRIVELHCIMPIANLGSVLTHGILSYERAGRVGHESVAMQPVQDRRDRKQVPGGLKLHQYANLYFNARNPMMYKRHAEAETLCVLSVSRKVLAISGSVITDCNAASDWVRFMAPSEWEMIVFDDVLAQDWRHSDYARFCQHRSRMCAEVLVPHQVPPDLVRGAYVVNERARDRVAVEAPTLRTRNVPSMFFS